MLLSVAYLTTCKQARAETFPPRKKKIFADRYFLQANTPEKNSTSNNLIAKHIPKEPYTFLSLLHISKLSQII